MVYKDFEGAFAPIPTPFAVNGLSVDYEYIYRHLKFLKERGVSGIVVLGTNGEFPSLSIEERKNVIAWVLKHHGDMKTVVHTGTSSLIETVDLSNYAIEKGADALMITTPYYYKNVNDIDIIDYYMRIFSYVNYPTFLYNFPKNTMIKISDRILEGLISHKNLLGLKDSSGVWEETSHYIKKFRQLHIFVGTDSLLKKAVDLGAGGGITAVCNSFPELVVSLLMSIKEKKDTTYLNDQLIKYRELIQQFPFQAATKYILHLRGIGESIVRPPLANLSEAQKRDLERGLEKLGFNFQDDEFVFEQ